MQLRDGTTALGTPCPCWLTISVFYLAGRHRCFWCWSLGAPNGSRACRAQQHGLQRAAVRGCPVLGQQGWMGAALPLPLRAAHGCRLPLAREPLGALYSQDAGAKRHHVCRPSLVGEAARCWRRAAGLDGRGAAAAALHGACWSLCGATPQDAGAKRFHACRRLLSAAASCGGAGLQRRRLCNCSIAHCNWLVCVHCAVCVAAAAFVSYRTQFSCLCPSTHSRCNKSLRRGPQLLD